MKQGDFTQVAKHYHNRPAYSQMLLEKLILCVGGGGSKILKIAEVGAGTGKMTRMLAEMGLSVVAVEPNDNMRNEGVTYTQDLSVEWKKGSGEETSLPNECVDWVMMASSFHWTDPSKSLPEFARILKSGGYFTAIWNPRHIEEGSLFDKIEREIRTIVPELQRVSSGKQNAKKWEEILISTGDFKDCFFMECDYQEVMSKERYLGAWHSVNDIQAQAGVERWEKILKMIEDKIVGMDEIIVPYKIRAWTARKVK